MKNLFILISVMISLSVFAAESKKKNAVVKPKVVEAAPVPKGEVYKKPLTEPSKLRKEFEAATGIVLGEYVAELNSEQGCQDGKLGIVDYGDELGLILGARSLVVGIGKEKLEETYTDCKLTIKSSYAGNVVEEISEEVCGDAKTTTKTTVTIEADKLTYTKNTDLGDSAPEEIKCVSNLLQTTPKEEAKK